jgi:DNA-binding SARP family transcriptional activator
VINFEVLGPVRAWKGEWEADLSPQQQLLLAALVMAEGKPVPRQHLVRALWEEPDEAPERALKRVVAELRKELRMVLPATDPLPISGDTYCLPLNDQQADVLRFRAKANMAQRDTPPESTRMLNEALAEWRGNPTGLFGGQPLSGLRGHWADSTRERLRSEYRDARYQCLWSEFKDERYGQVAAECGQLATEPEALADEKFLELWMIATYRAGQRIEVQDIYQRAMVSADTHYGMKLSSRVHELARIIRDEDPRLDGSGSPMERISASLSQRSPIGRESMNDVKAIFNNHDNTHVDIQVGEADGPITLYTGNSQDREEPDPQPAAESSDKTSGE